MRLLKKISGMLKKEVKYPVYIPVLQGEMLKDKWVLITGGSGGIGREIAKSCIRNGASVIVTGRDLSKLDNAVKEIKEIGLKESQQIIPMQFDLQNASELRRKIAEVTEKYSIEKIDALVNNAGISLGRTIGNTAEEDFDKVLDTNLKGTYFMAQEFSNYLIENKIAGNILNISSVSGIRPAVTPYMISKWGIQGLTEGLAKKLAKYNITVNAIAPGPTATEMLKLTGDDLDYSKSPAGRFVDPSEVANLAVFMISDMAKMIIGDTVFITGGCGNLTLDDINY